MQLPLVIHSVVLETVDLLHKAGAGDDVWKVCSLGEAFEVVLRRRRIGISGSSESATSSMPGSKLMVSCTVLVETYVPQKFPGAKYP